MGRCGDIDRRWEERSLSILRDRKSEFEGMTRFVIIESVLQKWIEWLWSTNMIAEILSIYLGVWERYRLTNDLFWFRSGLSIRYHFCECTVKISAKRWHRIVVKSDLNFSPFLDRWDWMKFDRLRSTLFFCKQIIFIDYNWSRVDIWCTFKELFLRTGPIGFVQSVYIDLNRVN
jgi:hypothetical protein